jgi:hypothetical protein
MGVGGEVGENAKRARRTPTRWRISLRGETPEGLNPKSVTGVK